MLKSKRRLWIWIGIVAVLLVGIVGTALLDIGGQGLQSLTTFDSDKVVPFVSTRGHFNDGHLVEGHTDYDYSVSGSMPGINSTCADEIMVIVHGFSNDQGKAENRFGTAKQSFDKNGFKGLVVGFSWDADTQLDMGNLSGYRRAKRDAILNGKKLAQFIWDVKSQCPRTRIRLLGYSMGARLVLEGLLALATDPRFSNRTWRVDSVHLLGAAVRNDEIQTDGKYGHAVERVASRTINYYSRKDDMLRHYFIAFERDRALGQAGIEHPDRSPKNFVSEDAADQLPTVSRKGEVLLLRERGENHGAYLGTRNRKGSLVDDGAIDAVVSDIRKLETLNN